MEEKEKLNKDIIPINQLLSLEKMIIPPYQRPYKWEIKNVIQLINDIKNHSNKPSYRIGTIVFHQEDKKKTNEKNDLNIVDGQQRIFTLSLIAYALLQNDKTKIEAQKHWNKSKEISLLKSKISNHFSKLNLQRNYKEIEREIVKFDEKTIRFFFENCEVVKIVLSDISEAFQFFDSQNARGKDLEPHDLLKAYHLREMQNIDDISKQNTIKIWENADDEDELAPLFALNLFRVKAWCKSKRGRYFTKDDNYLFKGIQLENKNTYPFTKAYVLNHYYTEEYNNHPHRAIDNAILNYPFQLDQPMINGKRFFDFVSHYSKIVKEIIRAEKLEEIEKGDIFFINPYKESNTYKIFTSLSTYGQRSRQGDKYIRNMFNNTVFYYIDKFGTEMLEENIIKLFIWSYRLRLTNYAVKLASIDNYTRESIKMFSILREAISPKEIQQIYIPELSESKIGNSAFELKPLFTEFKYLTK